MHSNVLHFCFNILFNVAEAYGLPYLPPYLAIEDGSTSTYKNGVNFAVAGATALDAKFYADKKLGHVLWTNSSLSVQLGWFKKLKSNICTTKQGKYWTSVSS